MNTVTVEVATIDTDDSITDGSLSAKLTAVTSPIELGSPDTSKVAIQHNNSVVTVTGPTGLSSVTVDENSSATLFIHVRPSVPNHRSLDVNLSYIDAISGTTEMRTIEVPAGSMSQDFQIPIGGDDIAAQSTRFFNVLLKPGDYVVGTPSSVAVSVLNDDDATVSISPVSDTITEGEDAVFKVMLDIEIAAPAAVEVEFEFTGNKESIAAINLRPVVVTFAVGEKSTEVAVETNNNNDLVMDSSLSATLTNAINSPLLISSTAGSTTIMILDDTPIVGVTTLDGDDPIQVLENADSVTLQLNINPTFNRALEVNVLYSGDPGALTGDFSSVTPVNTSKVVTVLANAATQTFDVEIIDDQIAAEFIRRVNVSVTAGLNYKVAASSSVKIAVVDNDIAAVSISALKDRVIEGDTIVFTVTRNLATDQATSISLTLTYNGDFFSTAGNTLNLDNGDGIHLNLTGRHKRNGKVYYYLDHNDNSNPDNLDQITHILLDNLLNDGANTINTQPDGHDGSNDERSVIIDGYALVLPTAAEIRAFLTAGNNEVPDGWANGEFYWAAGPFNAAYTANFHESVEVPGDDVSDAIDSETRYVFFQVLTAQRTTIVNLPAEQMNTVMVEVATIDTDDSITDGSLIAKLKLIEQDDSPIELGRPDTSEVAILHNNFVVTVTGPNGKSSVSVDEDSSVDLVLNVEPSVPDRRSLGVGLSYIDIISGTTNMITITVPEGSMLHRFSIPVGGDSIAAQSTRFFNVLIEPDIGYVVGTSSSVAVSVLNDDPAVVSILPVRDPITEGDFAVFEVQVSNEIAVSLTVTINFTTVENFGISPGSTKLVITADNTTALLTVGKTINDKIGEAYGSLTAAIVSPLTLPESIFGVKPTISATHSSATITILDDDLDLSVRITTLDKKASTTISESDEVISLRLMLSVAINRPLRVNLSRDTEISGIDLPSFVEVPAEMTTHNFSVFVIDDTIVAQSTRNINISVAAGVGYTASTDSVTVKVIDNDTATVTISPVNSTIVQSEPAVFKVMLGLETAVDVEIGIDVEFGEGFITNQGRSRTTVTVLAGQMSTLLTVPTVDNTEVEETSSLVATLVAIPHLALTIGDPSSATVVINALGPLSIAAMPASLRLVEGGDSTQISVSLSRIDAGRGEVKVSIDLEGSGLGVSTTLLTFKSTKSQTVTVTATSDGRYTGDRSATLTFTATDYATAMVTVDITEGDLQTIGLIVVGTTELSLVRFTSTEITVRVDIDADLMVKAEGAVRLAGDRTLVSSNLGEMGSTQIEISGVSEGKGTVSFMVSGARKATDTVVVSVTVTRPTLVISEVSPSNINLLTRETTVVTVSVSAIGNPSSTLKATVTGTGNSVTPTEIIGVRAGMPAMFRVTAGLDAGNTTLTLTASHPDYDSTSTKVDVRVDLRPLELSVGPSPLEVVIGTPEALTIGVSATEGATLTVTVDDDNIIAGLAAEYLLMSGETSTTIEVIGRNVIDATTLTITAAAEGYVTSARATVEVEVLERLSLAAEPVRVDLVQGASTEIRVRVSRIEGSEVTVEIAASTGLRVEPTSVTLTDRAVPGVTTVTADADYSGTATVTFEAVGYESTLVSVTITRAPTPELGQINLGVAPPALEIVTGASTNLTITAGATTATITISVAAGGEKRP